jgi:hypothetical protein
MDQVTIRAVLTQDTPRIIAALLADPRTDDTSQHPTTPASKTPAQDPISRFGRGTPQYTGSTAKPGSPTSTHE